MTSLEITLCLVFGPDNMDETVPHTCVIHSVGELFLLHITGQTKRIFFFTKKIFCLHLKNTIITYIGFCVFISLQ